MRLTASTLSTCSLNKNFLPAGRYLTTTSLRHADPQGPGWEGRQSHEHITNRKDNLNIQSDSSNAGKADRTSGQTGASQATLEEDQGNQNEQAKKDHPEAPGPVIGMNDERGGVSRPTKSSGWEKFIGLTYAVEGNNK